MRKLGSKITWIAPRRPVKTSAVDCEIRGGEYVSYDRADYSTALRVWLPSAEAGDPEAQNYVGEIYERGLGRPPDPVEAAGWYRRAAEQGFEPAQINLGQLYEQGLGVPRDLSAALGWYRRAAGIEAGLEFVPTDPEEVERLRAELTDRTQEAEALRRRLEELQAALSSRRKQRDQQESDLQAREAAIRAQEEDSRADQDALARRRQEIERLDGEIERLRRRVEEQRLEVERRSRTDPTPLAGPSILMIDPPLAETRGAQVTTAPGLEQRLIVGRVEAPAGMLVLTVNDLEASLGENGMFRTAVSLRPEGTLVAIVAIDRRGERADRVFALSQSPAAVAGPEPPKIPEVDFGDYYALVIGLDDYRFLPDLETAVTDAEAVAGLLERNYGFRVTLLRDATRYEILSQLGRLTEQLTSRDNLLIYYAGHGELDRVNDVGHWLPVDAEPHSSANWLSTRSISDELNRMKARHVLVVADSCYSGSLTRAGITQLETGETPEERDAWLRAQTKLRVRMALTSGGLEPVLDAGGGGHSVFARFFLEVLDANEGVLDGMSLYRAIAARVTYAAEGLDFDQVPEYAPIRHGHHENGHFLLVRVSNEGGHGAPRSRPTLGRGSPRSG